MKINTLKPPIIQPLIFSSYIYIMSRKSTYPLIRKLALLFIVSSAFAPLTANATKEFGDIEPTESEILRALDPPKVRQTKRAEPPAISLRINFVVNSDALSDSAATSLQTLAGALNSDRLKNRFIRIVGHTDASGPEAYNKELSLRRAVSVKKRLEELGVDASRLSCLGMGESQLLDEDAPLSGRNRRVEFVVVTKKNPSTSD
jgi:outer membrane protein OmpA-like peptidoglycan-associated protein